MAVKTAALAKKSKTCKTTSTTSAKPKRLSKLGQWMRDNPNGIGLIVHDMRALMR